MKVLAAIEKSMAGTKEAMQVRKNKPFVQYAGILTGI
jgi:hypothetical protein